MRVTKDLLGENTQGCDNLKGQPYMLHQWGQDSRYKGPEVEMGRCRGSWEELGISGQMEGASGLGLMESRCQRVGLGF